MISRILRSWSFLMKFMKLAEGSFHNFLYEMTTRVRSSIYCEACCPAAALHPRNITWIYAPLNIAARKIPLYDSSQRAYLFTTFKNVVGIFTFMSRKNFILSCIEHEIFITSGPGPATVPQRHLTAHLFHESRLTRTKISMNAYSV